MKHQYLAAAFVAAGIALSLAAPSRADTPVIAGEGWVYDQVDNGTDPSDASPLTFTLTAGESAQFSLVDGFVAGDTYTLTYGPDVFTSVFGFTAMPFDDSIGPAAGYFTGKWTDPTYSKIALGIGPGVYSFSITGDCAGGCPAGFGYRLDLTKGGVPEPAAWALMLLGFGGIGAALRKRGALATA